MNTYIHLTKNNDQYRLTIDILTKVINVPINSEIIIAKNMHTDIAKAVKKYSLIRDVFIVNFEHIGLHTFKEKGEMKEEDMKKIISILCDYEDNENN